MSDWIDRRDCEPPQITLHRILIWETLQSREVFADWQEGAWRFTQANIFGEYDPVAFRFWMPLPGSPYAHA
jgi:hypothetical protein